MIVGMDLDLRLIRALVGVADHGGLGRAARAMHLTQPALGRQIRRLELLLKTALVERGGQRLTLTPAGAVAAAQGRRLLELAQDLTRAARSATHPVRIGWFQPALTAYLAAAVTEGRTAGIDCELTEADPGRQLELLANGDIDIALPGHVCSEIRRRHRVRILARLPLAVVLPRTHPLADQPRVAIADLARDGWIGFEDRSYPGRNTFLGHVGRDAGFSPRIVRRADGVGSAIALVAAGQGILICPAESAHLAPSSVVFRPLAGVRRRIELTALTARARPRAGVAAMLALIHTHAGRAG